MSNQDTELKLVLTLDGKQFIASTNTSATSAAKLVASVDKIAISTAKVVKSNTAAVGSIDGVGARLQKLRLYYNTLTKSSADYERTARRVANLQNILAKSSANVAAKTSGIGRAAGRTGYAMQSMNRIIDDSAFGFVAISNNISPMLDSFSMVVKDAGGVKGALKQMGSSLIGPLGIATAVSVVTSLLTRYAMSNRGAAKETETLSKKNNNLSLKIRSLAADYKDLVEGNKLYREELAKTNLAEKEKDLADLKREAAKGGITENRIYFPYSESEKERYKKEIAEASRLVDLYKEKMKGLSPAVQENVDLLNGLSTAANEAGEKGIIGFLKNTSVSEDQFGNLMKQLKDYKSAAFGVLGGKAKGLTLPKLEISGNLNPVKAEVEKTIKILEKFWDSFTKEEKEIKDKKIEISIVTDEQLKKEIELAKAGYDQTNSLREKAEYYDIMVSRQKELNRLIIKSDEVKVVGYKPLGASKKLGKTAKPSNKGGYEYVDNSLDELQSKSEAVNNIMMTVGDTMVSGFLEGKIAIQEVGAEVGILIGKMALLGAIQYGVNTLALGPLGLLTQSTGIFHSGGIVGKADTTEMVNPMAFVGAPVFHNGGIVGRPAILQDGEIVLNEQQQLNLLGRLGTHQIYQSGIQNQQQTQKVEVYGDSHFDGRRFVTKFEGVSRKRDRMLRTYRAS